MRSPVTAFLAFFASGAVALQTCAALPAYPSTFAAASAIASIVALGVFRSNGWRRCFAIAACAASLGFSYAAWRAELRLADALPPQWEGVDLRISGIVDDLPQPVERGARFTFAVERVLTVGATVPTRLSLGWYAQRAKGDEAQDIPAVHAGERWALTVRLKRPHGNVNPAGFDLEAWLLEHDLRASGYVRPDASNALIDAFVGRPGDYIQRARESIRARIMTILDGEPYAGVLVALAIGDQRAIPEAQWLVFNRTGIAHLVSISGLHVTVFAALAGGLAFAVTRRSIGITTRMPARKIAAVVGAIFAFFYVLLAGAEVPAVRTLLMLWVGACGLWLGRPGTAAVVWLWSLVAVLIWDPWASLAPGFWLSFGAVGLLLFAGCGRLSSRPASSWRERVKRTLCEATRTQWVVTIGLVPATLALFQQFSLVSAIANAVAIPAVTLAIVPLALSGIVVPLDAIWLAAHALLSLLMTFLQMLAALPSAVWAQHSPAVWTVTVGTLGVILLIAPRGVPGRYLGVVWLLPVFLVRPAPVPMNAFRLTALDVGQGLAVVVETARHALVYDTGPRVGDATDAGGRIVAPYLRAAGIGAVDALMVSHQDLDHAGGALSLLQTVPVTVLWSSLPVESAIVSRASLRGTAWRCTAGQSWDWDGVTFTVLFPPMTQYSEPGVKTNDLSCVLRIDSPYGSALLTGDIEAVSEAWLLRQNADALRADALVVPHHGSKTSSTPPFVAAVAPSIAVFTPGYRNRFGHPRAEVVARYVRAGARLFRTDLDGAVMLLFAPEATRVAAVQREVQRRYWYDPPRASAAPLE
ncbi:MAG TPA: DNA internalization-related competence protein ComEC/Rec2 [Casimicrobiaceae bacterium]|nr:DNA internalization-related competence protein ComEC/Rec2 [Casimicrobiaceae bacterium]